MDNWIIVNKSIILVYIAFQFVSAGSPHIAWIVLAFLAYICLNMTVYLIRKRDHRKILLGVSILLLLFYARYLQGFFILQLPLNIFELVVWETANLWLGAGLAAIPLLWLDRTIVSQYFLAGALSLIFYRSTYLSWQRILLLREEQDRLREKNHSLSGQLTKDHEYERQLKYSSQLEERNKIAQEIHDQIGHALSGSLLQLEAAQIYLDQDAGRAREIIQTVLHILRNGLDNIRITLKNIKPPSEQLGLNRIKLMTEEFTAKHDLRTALVHAGNLDNVTPLQWKVIHDNINEALTNTMRHSDATAITVRIEVLNKIIKAEVRDNGRGAQQIKKGLGLQGMEERSGNIGGKMVIDGSQGFSIITLLPVEGD